MTVNYQDLTAGDIIFSYQVIDSKASVDIRTNNVRYIKEGTFSIVIDVFEYNDQKYPILLNAQNFHSAGLLLDTYCPNPSHTTEIYRFIDPKPLSILKEMALLFQKELYDLYNTLGEKAFLPKEVLETQKEKILTNAHPLQHYCELIMFFDTTDVECSLDPKNILNDEKMVIFWLQKIYHRLSIDIPSVLRLKLDQEHLYSETIQSMIADAVKPKEKYRNIDPILKTMGILDCTSIPAAIIATLNNKMKILNAYFPNPKPISRRSPSFTLEFDRLSQNDTSKGLASTRSPTPIPINLEKLKPLDNLTKQAIKTRFDNYDSAWDENTKQKEIEFIRENFSTLELIEYLLENSQINFEIYCKELNLDPTTISIKSGAAPTGSAVMTTGSTPEPNSKASLPVPGTRFKRKL